MDYIRQHCPKSDPNSTSGGKSGGKKGKGKNRKKSERSEPDTEVAKISNILDVFHIDDFTPQVVVEDVVKEIRPFIVACIVRNVDLRGQNFKKFIQLQTKLHDSVCDKRNAATIATHDLGKIPQGNIR